MVPPLTRPADAGATRAGSLLEAQAATPRTDLQVRNYDARPYAVQLVARDGDAVAVERSYDLEPGEFRAERAALDPGTYEVTATAVPADRDVTVDPSVVGDRDTATCRVGADPAETACVELGNHVVAVSEGVY